MISIKVNNRFLDIKPGASAETERRSPFFAIADVMIEYSTPIAFRFTENNAVALGYLFQYYSYREKTKVAAELYDGQVFKGKCTLIIEAGTMDLSNIENSEMNGYILFGVSDFYNAIKGKYLKDLSLGGNRDFAFTTNVPGDASGGYWQHFHDSWTDATIPYVFAPIRNDGFYTVDGDVDWMNKLGDDGMLLYSLDNPLVPQLRVKYIIEQIFIEHGYKVDFTGINDTEWENLLMVSTKMINWRTLTFGMAGDGSPINGYDRKDNITIKLAGHVPQEKMVSDFLLQFFNRYGIAPVFDTGSRTCRMVAVKEIGKKTPKDWTTYVQPSLTTSFSGDAKVYAFTNEIDSNDAIPSTPDFTNKQILEPAYTARYLTAPLAEEAGALRFCFTENAWYEAQLDTTTNLYEWVPFAYNIYNEEPANATDTITTTISTLPVVLSEYRASGGATYYGMFAIMQQSTFANFGYRFLVYHGMVTELTENGGAGVITYPYASSIAPDPLGTTLQPWSNVFTHKNVGGTSFEVDYGIIKYWWRNFLDYQNGEEISFTFWIPLFELIKYKWDDVIMVQGLRYIFKQMTEPLPYPGYIIANAKRIDYVSEAVVEIPPVEDVVYAHLDIINIEPNPDTTTWYDSTIGDVRIQLYSDMAGTIPYTPPSGLDVILKWILNVNGGLQSQEFVTFNLTASSTIVLPDAFIDGRNAMSSHLYERFYSLAVDVTGRYEII